MLIWVRRFSIVGWKACAAMQTMAEVVEGIIHSGIGLDGSRCLRATDRYSDCEACLRVCPEAAIKEGRPPVLDESACGSCFACLPACPMGVFGDSTETSAMLRFVARTNVRAVELLCVHNADAGLGPSESDVAIRIRGCVAGIGVGGYLSLAALGVEKILVRGDSCADCRWGGLSSQIEAHIAEAGSLLDNIGKAGIIQISLLNEMGAFIKRRFWDASQPPISRRDLFRMILLQDAADAHGSLVKPVTLPGLEMSEDRRRIIAAIRELAIGQDCPDGRVHPKLGFAAISITDACDLCGACARACPTGALRLLETASRARLSFSAVACLRCGICAHVCSAEALTVHDCPSARRIVEAGQEEILVDGLIEKCSKCGDPFRPTSQSRMCPLCTFRRDNPFGFRLPRDMESAPDRRA
jgi:ferredoxin